MIEKVCKVIYEGKEYAVLKRDGMYYGVDAQYIKKSRLTLPLETFERMRYDSKEAVIDAIERRERLNRLMESEGLTALEAINRLMENEKRVEYYRIEKGGMMYNLPRQIERGIDTFGNSPRDAALFRVWCYMLVNDELTPIARTRYSSTITALRWFEDNGWISVDDRDKVITIL